MFARYDENLGNPDIKRAKDEITELHQVLTTMPTRPENIELKQIGIGTLEAQLVVLVNTLAADEAHEYNQRWLAANRQEIYQFIDGLNGLRAELNFPRSVALEHDIENLQGAFNNLQETFGAEAVEHLRKLTLEIGLASTAGATAAAAAVAGGCGLPLGPVGAGVGAATGAVVAGGAGLALTLYKRHSARDRALRNVENGLRAEFDFAPQ